MISCIITTYKRPTNVLKRAIDSVIAQTYKDIEILVINDYPEDQILSENIQTLINEYEDERIRYISYKNNKGACAARNIGIDNSKGEYIAFLDDDDEWMNRKLETQLKYFSNSRIGMVYCDNFLVSKSGTSVHKNVPKTGENTTIKNLLIANFIGSTSFPLLRKEAILVSGKFDESLKSSQDLDLWIRIAEKYKCVYCNIPLVKYYIMEESITTNIVNKIEGYEYLLNKYQKYYESDITFANKKLINIAGELVMSGIYIQGFQYFIRGLKTKWYSINNLYYPARASLLRLRRILRGY